uniref:Uncharacterized protein n=1 Tax=Meloidogyne enterolobii TaxID=390850 RepID=A0A6V7X576_MELEN|nr:unnamed protein product [Meloidogyne enterolobii]
MVGDGGYDQNVVVFAENPFKKAQNCLNYSLYYFEFKCKFEKELNGSSLYMEIGLRNCSTTNPIYYCAKYGRIYNEKYESFKLSSFTWNNNDIFGCGIVYPPTNMTNEFPRIFFTQNGNRIGKGVLLKKKSDSYKPRVWLNCCSIEANFGNDLESKPFKYDISKHLILKEFY